MKINLKIKSVRYAKYVAEFLYKLHPVVLKEQLDVKKSFGKVLGFNDLNNLDYDKREQFAKLNDLSNKDNEVRERSIDDLFLNSDEVTEEIEQNIKYNKYLNEISNSQRKDFINLDFFIEVEDRQYGRMLAEFFDHLTEGCLEQAVLCKREEAEDARLIGRYTEVGDTYTPEESKILKENRWCSN